jgi:hypothetical protein
VAKPSSNNGPRAFQADLQVLLDGNPEMGYGHLRLSKSPAIGQVFDDDNSMEKTENCGSDPIRKEEKVNT